jgi:retron-type reverse transcriptase|tara:strand:+ start:99964 stop:100194 length:231 start_codon:yes stop_codon:yes gene_type:complete
LSESEPGIDGVTVEQLRDFCHQRWVADLDLEKFFDRVSHDVLIGRLARWIKDQRILKLIRANLRAGIREGHRQPSL